MKITFDEWVQKYKPVHREGSSEPRVFGSWKNDLLIVSEMRRKNPYCIWTLENGIENGKIWELIVSGYHFVNQDGYYITEVPFPEDEEVVVDLSDSWAHDESEE